MFLGSEGKLIVGTCQFEDVCQAGPTNIMNYFYPLGRLCRSATVQDSFLGPKYYSGAHHPISPVMKLGIQKKERKKESINSST